ncbi:MAG: AAA family ATPase [Cyanobacteria bacterium J06623_7]
MNSFPNYELIEKIYQDSRSQLSRAVFKLDGTEVLLKTISPHWEQDCARKWLQDELKLLNCLNAKNIIKVDREKTSVDRLMLILEDFPGQNFAQFLAEQIISVSAFLTIAIQLATALEEMQRQEIIHGNIQPNCIAINPQNLKLKIIDFCSATSLTSKNSVLPRKLTELDIAYIAPEQTGRMNVPLDCRTDFYALGILLYRSITGVLPYDAKDSLELIHYHLAQQPLAPCYRNASVPPIISSIVMKLLAKNPDDRYQSATAMKADLQNCQAQYTERGIVESFELGILDSCSKFIIPDKLYGRSAAFAETAESIAKINFEAPRMLLLRGSAGMGKTALIERVVPTIIGKRGCFITGRFESSDSPVPYQAITQALGELIRGLLKEASTSRQDWRQKIQQAIASNGKVITDILPELELIVGSQPDLALVSALERQNRFNTTFIKFLRVFAQPESPLILFIDNLQWADSASLNLIELLLDGLADRHLLIIGAYRQEQIGKDHPFQQTLVSLTAKVPIDRIVLQPLSIEEINSLLVDTFYCNPKRSLALAQLLLGRTHGNPFFIARLLETFYREKLISFNSQTLSWEWCIDEIRTTAIPNCDVLELVGKNFSQLTPVCQQLLKLAACIGNQFDLLELTELWHQIAPKRELHSPQQARETIANILDEALLAGIIIFEDRSSTRSYQFLHHHVNQAIYSSIAERELSEIHLVIGKFYLQTNYNKVELKIFEIVHHLNIAGISSPPALDLDRLVQLNLTASHKAKAANAYEVAANYADAALKLLPNSTWQENYPLILRAYQEAIEVQYLQGDFSSAERLCNIVLKRVTTVLDRVSVCKIEVKTHIAQNQMQSAVEIGLQILELLDIRLADRATSSFIADTYSTPDSRQLEFWRNLKPMEDPALLTAMETIAIIIPPTYITQPQLLPVLVEKAIYLSQQYGNCPFSAYAYAFYGLLLCAAGKIEAGYQVGILALELQQKFAAPEIKSKVSFLFNNMICHWQESAIATLDGFLAGIKDGVEVGDIEHACFHGMRYCAHLFYVGEPLSTAGEKSLEQIEFIARCKQDFQLNYARMWHQLNLNLRGKAENEFLLIGNSFDEAKFMALWQENNSTMSLFSFYLIKLILFYLLGDYERAIDYGRQGKQYLEAAIGLIGFGVYHFYYALAMLATCDQADNKSQYFAEILACQTKISHWSNHAPANYCHRQELITAEIAKISGESERAAEHYDLAIIAAERSGYLHESALAEERTSEFYRSRGKNRIANYYLNDAYQSYRRWEAWAKVQQLESVYPQLLDTAAGGGIGKNSNMLSATKPNGYKSVSDLGNLDLFSIIKASQAISSEIILDHLLSKMMAIVMENAGAQKSTLLLQQNSQWVVAAAAVMERSQTVSLPYVPISEYQNLPHSIINYVQSTQETVMLARANQSGMFVDDRYIIEHQPKSVLCCPMSCQNKLQGIIYLENSSIEGAFTAQKLSVLQALLSQVSISIVNARLYKDLEEHASVQKSLKQKEILLKEIHHRVKNNLFVVSSLLDFQSNYVEDPEVLKLLENCQNRITAMAMVHQHLYGNSELDTINFAQYIESLLDNLAYSLGSQERNINLILDLEPIELNIESANPCGLIVNELVSNALEHGFSDRDRGNIWLKLKHNVDEQIVLTIEDDGVGFKPGKNLQNSESLGLELVCTLVDQIDGQIELDNSSGTKIEIVFNELDYQSRI